MNGSLTSTIALTVNFLVERTRIAQENARPTFCTDLMGRASS
jgi:hypothetical protein